MHTCALPENHPPPHSPLSTLLLPPPENLLFLLHFQQAEMHNRLQAKRGARALMAQGRGFTAFSNCIAKIFDRNAGS